MLEEVLDTLQVINSRLQSIENRQQSMDGRLESIEKHVAPSTLGESKYYVQYEIMRKIRIIVFRKQESCT